MGAKRILVVEDDNDIRESLFEILSMEGYVVSCAVNGQDGLDQLKDGEFPDLILLDLMMPIKDGFAFREEMKLEPKYASIPIIIMSADGHTEQKKAKIGAKEYLKKPVSIDKLISTIDRVLQSVF